MKSHDIRVVLGIADILGSGFFWVFFDDGPVIILPEVVGNVRNVKYVVMQVFLDKPTGKFT